MALLNIALIGCGKMGSAMLRGWLAAKIVGRVFALEPAGMPEEFTAYAPNPVAFFDNAESFAAGKPNADICVIAVKPQILETACRPLVRALPETVPVLSIAAGQTIAAFESLFGADRPVIRAMPNTPAAIGQGVSVAVANAHVTPRQKEQAEAILRSVGAVEWIEQENLMNAVTAVSGSGPAYIFLLIETLAKAGEKAGLPPGLSMRLARRTVIGSAALAGSEPDVPASKLRENVTSPGGTTEAALKILMGENGLESLMTRAIDAATARGRELGA